MISVMGIKTQSCVSQPNLSIFAVYTDRSIKLRCGSAANRCDTRPRRGRTRMDGSRYSSCLRMTPLAGSTPSIRTTYSALTAITCAVLSSGSVLSVE
jgi:hypothetical protein